MSIRSNLRRQKRQLVDITNLFESFFDADNITSVLLDNPELQSLQRKLKFQLIAMENTLIDTTDKTRNTKFTVEKIEREIALLLDKFKYLTEELLDENNDSLDSETGRCIKGIHWKITVIETDLNRLKVAIAANLKGEV